MDKKILVVEDNRFKYEMLERYINQQSLEVILHLEEALNPAIHYMMAYNEQIAGVILDLGLPMLKSSNAIMQEYSDLMGLEFVAEMYRCNIQVPILFFSETDINWERLKCTYSNIKGQIKDPLKDSDVLENFIKLL